MNDPHREGGEGVPPSEEESSGSARHGVVDSTPSLRSPIAAWLLAAVGALAAFGALWLAEPRSVLDSDRLELSPRQLVERAREVLTATTGWRASDEFAFGFEYDEDFLAFLDLIPDLGDRRTARRSAPPPIRFWYRQSSDRLRPAMGGALLRLGFDAPPLGRPGEVALRLGALGRLTELLRWPRPSEPRQQEEAWEPVFSAAGLDLVDFRELYARFVPPVPTDARYTWTGTTPLYVGEEIEAEGGTVEGRPTFFRYAGNWRTRVPPPVHDLSTLPRGAFAILVLYLGALAWRHRRTGAADRSGDRRFAVVAGVVALLALVQSPARVLRTLDPAFGFVLVGVVLACAAAAWLGAAALGPRLAAWPRVMGSWRLLFRGEWRRPEVASSVLVGASGGALLALLAALAWWLPVWLGHTAVETKPSLDGLAGGWAVVDALLHALARAAVWTGLFAFVLDLGRALLRFRPAAAVLAAAAVLLAHLPSSSWGWGVLAVSALLWVAILVRWGLLAALLASWIQELFSLALVTDLGHWAAQTAWAVIAVVALLLITSAWLAGRGQLAAAPAR